MRGSDNPRTVRQGEVASSMRDQCGKNGVGRGERMIAGKLRNSDVAAGATSSLDGKNQINLNTTQVLREKTQREVDVSSTLCVCNSFCEGFPVKVSLLGPIIICFRLTDATHHILGPCHPSWVDDCFVPSPTRKKDLYLKIRPSDIFFPRGYLLTKISRYHKKTTL